MLMPNGILQLSNLIIRKVPYEKIFYCISKSFRDMLQEYVIKMECSIKKIKVILSWFL